MLVMGDVHSAVMMRCCGNRRSTEASGALVALIEFGQRQCACWS